jgi:synaptobrevin family protein YKT6
MRLFSIAILRNDSQPAVQLASAQDLSTFSFFQRSAVGQFMTFFSQTIAERTKAGQRQDVEDNTGGAGTSHNHSPRGPNTHANLGYVGHAYARTDGLVGIIISDKDYPLRVAYSLLTKILDEFSLRYPPSKFQSAGALDFPELHSVRLLR